jgi:hypothetical protein
MKLFLFLILAIPTFAQTPQTIIPVEVHSGNEFAAYIQTSPDAGKRTYQRMRVVGIAAPTEPARAELLERAQSALAMRIEGQPIRIEILGKEVSGFGSRVRGFLFGGEAASKYLVRVTLIRPHTFPDLTKAPKYADFRDEMPRIDDQDAIMGDLATALLLTGRVWRNEADNQYLYTTEIETHKAAALYAEERRLGIYP